MSEKNKLLTSNYILQEILDNIEKINFREYVETLNSEQKLLKKHFLVATVEILLNFTNTQKFSLCRKNEMIYLFNEQYWEYLDEGMFKDFLSDFALKLGVDKFDGKHHQFKDELLKQFISDARLKDISTNSQTTLINLLNGTFEISSSDQFIRDFKKEDFLTYQLPFEYNPNAKMTRFKQFLDEVLPEKELQEVLSEYIGYIFIKGKSLKLEKVLLLYGTGANGKSVFFEVISALLGQENITNFSLQSLTGKDGYYRAMISNKLLNYASEINGSLEASYFKSLSSGEPVEARLPYGKPQIISDYAKLIFNCNELPKDTENTTAFFRRFIIIPFRKTISPEKQNKKLAEEITQNELSGIFNWVIDGLRRLIQNEQFTKSDIIENEIKQYELESDSVAVFLEFCDYESSIVETISSTKIYYEYKTFCRTNSYISSSQKTFSQRLHKLGIVRKKTSANTVYYIQKKCFN